MKSFTDLKNNSWSLSLTIASAKRVRDQANFDIASNENQNILINLLENPILIADVAWAMILPQAVDKNIDAETFAEALDGDKIEELQNIILEEYINFSGSRSRPAIKKQIAVIQELELKTNDLMMKKMDAMNFETLQPEILKILTSGAVASGLQGSLASTQEA